MKLIDQISNYYQQYHKMYTFFILKMKINIKKIFHRKNEFLTSQGNLKELLIKYSNYKKDSNIEKLFKLQKS